MGSARMGIGGGGDTQPLTGSLAGDALGFGPKRGNHVDYHPQRGPSQTYGFMANCTPPIKTYVGSLHGHPPPSPTFVPSHP
jgi:hypothetical protein